MSLAVTVFMELASAYSSVTISPYSSSLLSGHHRGGSLPGGKSMHVFWLGNSSQGSAPKRSAVAYTNGLNVEPT